MVECHFGFAETLNELMHAHRRMPEPRDTDVIS
jgi:hypothetical protein